MTRILTLCAAISAILLAAPVQATDDPVGRQEMKAADFLLGNWSCTHTFGDGHGTYTTTYQRALSDFWLKQMYNFSATNYRPPMQAEYFLGYDARFKRWVRFGAMSDSMYFAMIGSRTGDTWSWRYVLPGRGTHVETFYTKRSDTEYTVDGPTYPLRGKMITEHHRCQKQSRQG